MKIMKLIRMKRIIIILIAESMMISCLYAQKQWVDLGLPSGTLWASVPEEDYYTYDEAVEKFGVNMPTKWQWQELLESCSINDLNSKEVELVGKNGKSIIIPLKGHILNNRKVHNDGTGYFRTSNSYDKQEAYYVLIQTANVFSMPITYKERYKMSVLLVNK